MFFSAAAVNLNRIWPLISASPSSITERRLFAASSHRQGKKARFGGGCSGGGGTLVGTPTPPTIVDFGAFGGNRFRSSVLETSTGKMFCTKCYQIQVLTRTIHHLRVSWNHCVVIPSIFQAQIHLRGSYSLSSRQSDHHDRTRLTPFTCRSVTAF